MELRTKIIVYNNDFVVMWKIYEKVYHHNPGHVSKLMIKSLEKFGDVAGVKVEQDCVTIFF